MEINPVEYFREYDFAESLVQRIAYRAELNQLEFILLYMGFVPTIARPLDNPAFQYPWDFRRLLFEDVTGLERTNSRLKVGFQGYDPANFNLPETITATIEVEAASVRKIVDARRTLTRYRAGVSLGALGVYRFDFGGLFATQRLVQIVPLPGGAQCHADYQTGQRVDFDNPFDIQ